MATFKIMRAELFTGDDIDKLKAALDQIPSGEHIIVAFEERTNANLGADVQKDIRKSATRFLLTEHDAGNTYYIANSVESNIAGDDKGKHGGNSLDSEKGKPGGGNALDNLLPA